jgi:glycosyltransferase involved in cell wall biosynthesis
VAPGPNLSGTAAKGRRRQTDAVSSAPKIVCVGHANAAKGYRLLPDAARLVLSSDANATFYIHGRVEDTNAVGDLHVFEELSTLGPRVVVNSAILTPEEYLAWLMKADIVLLPYDEEVYKTRGSGVFNEAREMGIPVVASRRCAFAQPSFEGGWGVAIVERSAQGIAKALHEALANLPKLKSRAEVEATKHCGDTTRSVLARSIAHVSSTDSLLRAITHRLFRRFANVRLRRQQQ